MPAPTVRVLTALLALGQGLACAGGEIEVGRGGGGEGGGDGGAIGTGAMGGMGGQGGEAGGPGFGARLVVAGRFGGDISLAGTNESLVASTASDTFAYTIGESGEERLHHLVAGKTGALVVHNQFLLSEWFICGEFEGEIVVRPGASNAWEASSVGGSDVFCAWNDPFLLAGPGEERLGGTGHTGSSNAGSPVPQPGPFLVFGGASEGAEVVRGASRTPLPPSRGAMDGFVAHFSPAGVFGGADTLGGVGRDMVRAVHQEGASDFDVEMIGTFGGGQATASATFGNARAITVPSHGGSDVFFAAFDTFSEVTSVMVAGGPGDDDVTAYAPYLEFGAGGSRWTARAAVAGSYATPPFTVAGLDGLDGACVENGFVLAAAFPVLAPSMPEVPEATSLTPTCNVAVSSMVLSESGAFAAGDHGPGAALDLGSGTVALTDPPTGGRAAFLGWFPSTGESSRWLTRLSSTGSIQVLDLCTASDPSTFAQRWILVGAFEGTAVFAEGSGEEVTLDATDGADGFVAILEDDGRLVRVVQLRGMGDQKAESCAGL